MAYSHMAVFSFSNNLPRLRKARSLLLVAVVIVCGCAGPQRADSLKALNLSPKSQAVLVQTIRSHTVYLERWSRDGSVQQSCGAATVLTNDGYLLTAAHCLGPDASEWQFIAFPDDPQTLHLVALRRVWVGDRSRAECDIALVKVSHAGLTAVAWCNDADMKNGAWIVAAGANKTDRDTYITTCAGQICQPPEMYAADMQMSDVFAVDPN
jgi:Trypsin-like peptidase domain